MASIFKKISGSYEVQWGPRNKRRSKSFKTKKEAREFALAVEKTTEEKAASITFYSWLENYRDTESIKKRGAREERIRISRLMRSPLAEKNLTDLRQEDFQTWVENRQNEPSPTGGKITPATVIREFTTMLTIMNFAVKKGFLKKNPAQGVELPEPPPHRERVASEKDQEALLLACGWDGESVPKNNTQLTVLAFLFSCRTGMRAGEILAIEDAWIEGPVIHLPKEATKTATRRDVALNSEAIRLLNLARQCKPRNDDSARIFSTLSNGNRDALFRKVRDRAGLGPVLDSHGNVIKEGLNFHDGRATFATWAASPDPKTGAPRLDVLALARQTGHKNLKMLQRYYRESAENIAKRLD